jgi:hypothetical protein
MADIAKFSILTFQRKPGLWRASVTPADRRPPPIASRKNGEEVFSVLTPRDFPTEELAQNAAKDLVKNL